MIAEELEIIKALEDQNEFKAALDRYETLYADHPLNFNLWQHYFFLTWYLRVHEGEVTSSEFNTQNGVLRKMLSLAKVSNPDFEKMADYHFIIGYAQRMFPYHFGDYLLIEEIGKRHMNTCLEIDSENLIYQKFDAGFSNENESFVFSKNPFKIAWWVFTAGLRFYKYDKTSELAKAQISKRFSGKGVLNRYFSSLP